LILHDWTHQLYFSLHVTYQAYGYIQLIAEPIRSTSVKEYVNYKQCRNSLRTTLVCVYSFAIIQVMCP